MYAVLAVVMVGVVAVALLVGTAQLQGRTGVSVLLDMQNVKPARTEMLWFGPGISDELNRMVKLGKDMSPKLTDYIKKGLEAQAKQVHLDEMHQGEIGHAAGEADLWSDGGGNNNGGNEPCMLPPGECPILSRVCKLGFSFVLFGVSQQSFFGHVAARPRDNIHIDQRY